MRQEFIILAGGIPASVLVAAVTFDRFNRKRRGERLPVSDKLLRPAGHSLQIHIEKLTDDYIMLILAAVLCSLASVGALGFPPPDATGRSVWLGVGATGAGVCSVMAWRKRTRIRYARLGLIGEQAMAEYLAVLASKGCRLFHDVPVDRENIDHVVVGPPGVFAIETKFWSKRPGTFNEAKHEAVFDGNTIRFPWGKTDRPLNQARRNKRWLEKFLSESTGERVAVQPIVALPGWWVSVTVKTDSGVWVLSGKQVAGRITSEPPKFSPKTIQQIAHQLEQKCRDVEF
jgi:hypothetical protein